MDTKQTTISDNLLVPSTSWLYTMVLARAVSTRGFSSKVRAATTAGTTTRCLWASTGRFIWPSLVPSSATDDSATNVPEKTGSLATNKPVKNINPKESSIYSVSPGSNSSFLPANRWLLPVTDRKPESIGVAGFCSGL